MTASEALAAGNWDAAERGVDEACETIAQLETPGPWAALFGSLDVDAIEEDRRALATSRRAPGIPGEALPVAALSSTRPETTPRSIAR